MPSFSLTNKAVADLLEIGRYTEKNWGLKQRNKYLSMIDETFLSLAENPFQGQDCSDLRKDYRKKNVGSHVIFYRQINDKETQIVRILHGYMDFSSHL